MSLDIRLLDEVTTWELQSSCPGSTPKLRHWLLLSHQEVFKIVSRSLATAIREADTPCSVKTAQRRSSSLTLSPPEHDSPFVLFGESSSDTVPSGSRSGRFFCLPSLDGELLHWILRFSNFPPFFVNCGFGVWYFRDS